MSDSSEQKVYDFVILGAGVAGLAFALEVQERGFSVLVIERDNQIGGLSKTIEYKGFFLDYCAHRFHSANVKVMDRVKEIMGDNFYRHFQRSRILMFGRFLKYPFELQNLLRAMPIFESALCAIDFASNTVKNNVFKKTGSFSNYRDWFVNHFGRRLYKIMCEPYTTKIWKVRPELISADWADQRFQGINLRKLIKRIILKIIKLDFSSYSLDDENLAPDGGEFYYPLKGIQQLPDRYADIILTRGGSIVTGYAATKLSTDSREVYYKNFEGKEEKAKYSKGLVSTVPLHNLYKIVGREDKLVEKNLTDLKYMNIILVYLFCNKPSVSKDHWLYFPDNSIIFNRSVEFKNWSEDMAPSDKTAICLDITCYEGDETWNMSDSQLVEKCIEGTAKAGLLEPSEVYDSMVVKVKNAYPFYDLDYHRKVISAVKHLEKEGDVFCLGRTGIFQYNNADGSIEMAMELADRLTSGLHKDQASLLGYKFKDISY